MQSEEVGFQSAFLNVDNVSAVLTSTIVGPEQHKRSKRLQKLITLLNDQRKASVES